MGFWKNREYAFNYLKTRKINYDKHLIKSMDIVELAEIATISFCNSNSSLNYQGIKADPNRRKLIAYNTKYGHLKSTQSKKLYPQNYEKYLTDYQKKYLDKISHLILKPNITVENKLKKFKEIENDVIKYSDQNEKEIILIACSIGRHSLKYWNKNYNKWVIELGGQDNKINYSSRLKTSNIEEDKMDQVNNVLYGDVSGAVGGFLYGAYVGAVSGTVILPGVGSLTGAIVGGLGDAVVSGIMGSTAGGLWNLFN